MTDRNKYIIESQRPQYTSYEITRQIKKAVSEYGGIDEIKDKFNVDIEIVKSILNNPKLFSLKMYKVASKILEKTLEELTNIQIDKLQPDFRKCRDCETESVYQELKLANIIFDEIIINKKMNVDNLEDGGLYE